MGLTKLLRGGLHYLGKRAINSLDSMSGGLSSHIGKKVLDIAHKNAGVIGKTVGDLGRKYLSDKSRNFLSKASDVALKVLPEGKIKDTMEKISNSAKNKPTVNLGNAPTNKYKSPDSTISPGATSYGQYTKPRVKTSPPAIF